MYGDNIMKINELVKDKDLKLTHARAEILEKLSHATRPLSYDEIKEDISMDKATFYRNITTFEEKMIVNSFESNDRKRYFEVNKSPHPHFICTHCNKIECINEPLNFNLEGYIIENIILKGICKECQI
jgi:Fur family ferric uptake transcriptional regulator